MKKIVIPLLALVTVVSIIFAGCTQSATPSVPSEPEPVLNPYEGLGIKTDGTPYRFAHVPLFLYNEWVAMGHGYLMSAFERAGATIDLFNSNLDAAVEMATLQDIQANEYDGIAILPVDSASAGASIDSLWAAGIPAVSWDYKPASDNLLCHCEEDQYLLGQVGGQFFVDYVERTGEPLKILELWASMAQDGCIRRHNGFHSVVDGNPLITVVESAPTNHALEPAQTIVLDQFSADPELNALWAMADTYEGYTQGLAFCDRRIRIGDPGHVVIFTGPGEPGALQALRDGIVDAVGSMSCWVECDLVSKALLTYVCLGEDVPSEQFVPPIMIGPDDTEQPYLYGNMRGIPFDDWPIIPDEYYESRGFSDYIPTPSK